MRENFSDGLKLLENVLKSYRQVAKDMVKIWFDFLNIFSNFGGGLLFGGQEGFFQEEIR